MKTFELFSESKKKGQNGRRKFKLILYKIYPDECIDVQNEVGTQYNLNGITWIREYCEQNLDSIEGMFLRCEFLNDERTEICGHGLTDIVDDVPIFENATTIGRFTKGYIQEIEDENGEKILVCIGEGEIDSSCYHNFCEKLDDDIALGNYPQGSVEIMRTEDEDRIIYKYGYKEKGRIPVKFIHSGYVFLGIKPSDSTAKLLELNNKKEETIMNEAEVKALVEQTVSTYKNAEVEINQCKEDCAKQIAEANSATEAVIVEKNALQASVDELQAAIEKWKADYETLNAERDALWAERDELQKALGEAKARERIGEMNAAIADFSDEEKAYAQAEIDAFKENPESVEINSIIGKIYEGIGKTTKADAAKREAEVAEQNAQTQVEDIFSAVESAVAEDTNIF
jgi:phage shock protein A